MLMFGCTLFCLQRIDSPFITAIFKKRFNPDILAITSRPWRAHSWMKSCGWHKNLPEAQNQSAKSSKLTALGGTWEAFEKHAALWRMHHWFLHTLVTELYCSHTKVMLSGDGGGRGICSTTRPNLFITMEKIHFQMGSLVFRSFR